MSSKNEMSPKPSKLDRLKKRAVEFTAVGAMGLTLAGCASAKEAPTTEPVPQPVSTSVPIAERPLDSSAESIQLSEEEFKSLETQLNTHFTERAAQLISDPTIKQQVGDQGELEFVNEDGNVEAFFSVENATEDKSALGVGFRQENQMMPENGSGRDNIAYYGVSYLSDAVEQAATEGVTTEVISNVINDDEVELFHMFHDLKEERNIKTRVAVLLENKQLAAYDVDNGKQLLGTDKIVEATEYTRAFFVTEGGLTEDATVN